MGLHRFKPVPSGRMGLLWSLSTIKNAAIVEFGCMGHMLYSGVALQRAGIHNDHMYTTHIDETDIALGRTERLESTVEWLLSKQDYDVIFFIPSAVPEVIGIDLPSLCAALEEKYLIKCISFSCGGFNKYNFHGVEEALYQLTKSLVKPLKTSDEPMYNIIGSCGDYFRFYEDLEEIKRLLKSAFGIKPNCILTSDTSIRDIEDMTRGQMNIVIRDEGIKTAEYLKKHHDMPYFVGRPYGIKGTTQWLSDIGDALSMKVHEPFVKKETEDIQRRIKPIMMQLMYKIRSHPEEMALTIGGPREVVKGIRDFAVHEFGIGIESNWCHSPSQGCEDIPYLSEEAWTQKVKNRQGLLMASGEILEWAEEDLSCQICQPDVKWRLHHLYPPLVGYKGALNIISAWINASADK